MHTINTFLFSEHTCTREGVYAQVKAYVAKWPGVRFAEDRLPFGLPPGLRVVLHGYFFCVAYIDGPSVFESVAYLESKLGRSFPTDHLVGEVRVTFADDASLDFDHFTVRMYQFLESLPGAVVYDDIHKRLLASKV